MSKFKNDERSDNTIACFMLEGSIDELIECLELKKKEGFTSFEIYNDGIRDSEDYILQFNK